MLSLFLTLYLLTYPLTGGFILLNRTLARQIDTDRMQLLHLGRLAVVSAS